MSVTHKELELLNEKLDNFIQNNYEIITKADSSAEKLNTEAIDHIIDLQKKDTFVHKKIEELNLIQKSILSSKSDLLLEASEITTTYKHLKSELKKDKIRGKESTNLFVQAVHIHGETQKAFLELRLFYDELLSKIEKMKSVIEVSLSHKTLFNYHEQIEHLEESLRVHNTIANTNKKLSLQEDFKKEFEEFKRIFKRVKHNLPYKNRIRKKIFIIYTKFVIKNFK